MIGKRLIRPVMRECFYIWRYDPQRPKRDRWHLDRYRVVEVPRQTPLVAAWQPGREDDTGFCPGAWL